MDAPKPRERLRFGPFVLDTRRAELLRDGVVVALRPKPFALLATLAANPGTVLGKEELLAAVWPGVVVTDDSLAQAIHELRTALADAGPRLIRTIPRRGYRLDADVVDVDAPAMRAGEGSPPEPSSRSNGPMVALRRTSTLRRVAALAFVVSILAGVAHIVGGPLYEPPTPQGETLADPVFKPPRLSLVVLPLDVEAASEAGAWFGASLSADLTTELGKVSGTVVISRDTAFSYKGRQVDPREVARQLNVRYVVQGTVTRNGNDVRLHLALVDGENGRQRWAERFTMDRANLSRLLEQVTGEVSRTLGVEMYRAEGQRAAALKPEQVEADDLRWSSAFRAIRMRTTSRPWPSCCSGASTIASTPA